MAYKKIYERLEMASHTHIAKWGSGLAVRIPKAVADQWGVREGTSIEISNDGAKVVLRKQKYNLEDMLARMDPETLRPEVDFGAPMGDEAW